AGAGRRGVPGHGRGREPPPGGCARPGRARQRRRRDRRGAARARGAGALTPRLGLVLPLFSGSTDRVLGAARNAEALGYDGVVVFDHFFPPGASPERPSLEAFTTLAAVGAVTTRVRVGTLVARAQLRPAGLLAKMAAGIDDITGGRMILGVGTGDPIDEPEHRAFGIPTLSKSERRVHL